MNEAMFEKIERYLNGELSNEERLQFESERASNDELASMVNLYNTIDTQMRGRYGSDEIELRKTLGSLNANYFKTGSQQPAVKQKHIPVKKINLLRWIPYSIAASVIIVAALFYLGRSSPHRLADNYISENLMTLNHTMGSADDSLQAGISAYNNKNYDEALRLFRNYYFDHPGSSTAKKYIGFVYLVTRNYDTAFAQFDELSNMKGLQSNPGRFLKAVTLLERDKKGDAKQAEQILLEVVEQKSEGSAEAEKWLKKF